jgi:hypothetical protein
MTVTLRAGAALVITVSMSGSGSVRASVESLPRRATLEFRVLSGGGRMATALLSSTALALAEGGRTGPSLLRVEKSLAADGTCSTVVRLSDEGSEAAPPVVVWEVGGTVRRAQTGRIEIEYTWRRVARGSQPQAGGHGEVILEEDDRVLLDLVHTGATYPAACGAHVALELGASIPADPALAERRLAYDLWLVTEHHGRHTQRQLKLVGRQGEKVDFDFGSLASTNGGDSASVQAGLRMVVSGHLRGRVQPDGSMEIALRASRVIRHDHWMRAEHGEKVVQAHGDDTFRMELPPPGAVPEIDAVTFREFAGRRVALVLTAAPLL